MPSSTSSSDVPYREIPERRWGRAWLICALLLVAAMAGWEILARNMQHLPGDYDEYSNFTAQWAEERRKLDEPGHDVRVVLLGSSRMLWAADLDILEQALGTRPLQLAIAGTGPALFLQDLVDNTDFDGLVLIGVTPFLFNRLDEGFFGAESLQWYKDPSPSALVGHRLNTALSEHFGFMDDGFKLFELIDHYSNFPDREGAWDLSAGTWKLGRHFEDRQTDLWAPLEVEGSFDNAQILAFWNLGLGRDPEDEDRMAEMASTAVEFFAPLVEQLRERGGDAVFIRMPSSGKYLDHDLAANYRELTWDKMARGVDAVWINSMDYAGLSSDLAIPEWSHLSAESQDDFSRRIAPILEQRFLDTRGHGIHDVITAPRRTD